MEDLSRETVQHTLLKNNLQLSVGVARNTGINYIPIVLFYCFHGFPHKQPRPETKIQLKYNKCCLYIPIALLICYGSHFIHNLPISQVHLEFALHQHCALQVELREHAARLRARVTSLHLHYNYNYNYNYNNTLPNSALKFGARFSRILQI